MRNASGSSCCGSKATKADQQTCAAEQQDKSGCCGDGEAREAQAERVDAVHAQGGNADQPSGADRKRGCC